MIEPTVLKTELLAEARRMGCDLAGIAAAGPAETRRHYFDWIAAGHAGEMAYLSRDPERRSDPQVVWPETASILVVGVNYRPSTSDPEADVDPRRGRIASYALGADYHDVIKGKLHAIRAWVERRTGGEVEGRCYVDTGPVLERDLAARAGLGWFGKNTCILNRSQGSYFFLGALMLNVELPPDGAASAHCGTCTRCLDVCPTGAFLSPHVMDARRCISYLTIELRGPIPRELRPLVGNWIFGCDLCQEVCPWNRKSAHATEPRFTPRANLRSPELIPLLELTQDGYNAMFRKSAVKRAKLSGFLRNVCVALGNSGDSAAIEPLIRTLRHDEPLVRGHAAWALGRLGGGAAAAALHTALSTESDDWVREELQAALDNHAACSLV
ncbi:MAG: tRNA epoxyqueuosine(34) reductase QueG [Actinomycetota bacterium]